ncbi:MAG: response regulator transcription factor [Cyanobacteria bacterium HKST-UBA02]|nr:response regulator transcription factor [Cyanobacteria bacterium HKST-UBA02]
MSPTDSTNLNTDRSLSILIADDTEYFRNWLRGELKRFISADSEIRESDDPKESISKAISQKPDLVFMDIDFKTDRTFSGIQAASEIWKSLPDVAVIIVSSYDDQIYLKQLLDAAPEGASYGYLLKDNVVRDLKRAVSLVLSGEGYIDPQLSLRLTKAGRKTGELTDGQYEVLVCIALGLSDKTIAKLLYLREQSVQARLRSLYRSFGIPSKSSDSSPDVGLFSSRCRAVWTAIKTGLLTEAELLRMIPQIQEQANRANMKIKI